MNTVALILLVLSALAYFTWLAVLVVSDGHLGAGRRSDAALPRSHRDPFEPRPVA